MGMSSEGNSKVGTVGGIVRRTYGRGVRESEHHNVGGHPVHTVMIKVPGMKGSAFVGAFTKQTYTGAKGGPKIAGKGR